MASLAEQYDALNAEIKRLNARYVELAKHEDKAYAVVNRWRAIADKAVEACVDNEMALQATIAKRERLVGRLMKTKHWLPPEKVAVAWFEE